MIRIQNRSRRGKGPAESPLPLLEYIERCRWADAPRAARMLRRRWGVMSASTAGAIAEAAGFSREGK